MPSHARMRNSLPLVSSRECTSGTAMTTCRQAEQLGAGVEPFGLHQGPTQSNNAADTVQCSAMEDTCEVEGETGTSETSQHILKVDS